MIRHRYTIIALLAAGGACSDLPSHDDPRDYLHSRGGGSQMSGGHATGTCGGADILCDDRTQSQCNGGCTITTACHSPLLEECAPIRSPDACDSDPRCRWSLGACTIRTGSICSINESQTACNNAPLERCVWGPTCSGFPQICVLITTQAECSASFGCTWTPG